MSMCTEKLPPHYRVERHPEALWLSRLPGFWARGRADTESPDHMGVRLRKRIGAKWHANSMKLQQEEPLARDPAVIGGTNGWWEPIVRQDQGVCAQALC